MAEQWTLPPPGTPQADSVARSTARLNIWHGPVRSGKTVGANLRWLEFVGRAAAEGRPGDLLMWGKTERTLKRNVLDPIEAFLGERRFRYNRGEGEAFIFGRRVHVAGANDERAAGKIQGATYLGAYGDELALTPDSFLAMALSRLSLEGAALFGTTNPAGPYHRLKTEFIDRAIGSGHTKGELNLRAFTWPIEANPHLGRDYIESLKAEYGGPGTLWYKRYILGLWVQAAGAVYEMFDEAAHVRPHPGMPNGQHGVGVDYGTSNPTAFVHAEHWRVTSGGLPRAHVDREHYHDGRTGGQRTDAQHADALAAFCEPIPGRPPVYVDPSAASFIAVLRQRRFNVVPADNAVVDGVRFVSSLLSQRTPHGWPRLTVAPGCEHLRREFGAYVWDERAQRLGVDAPLKAHDHALDALRYRLWTALGAQGGGVGAQRNYAT